MDNSQSSDVFSQDKKTMDYLSYEELLASTKKTLTKNREDDDKEMLLNYLDGMLVDCASCINQNIELVNIFLQDTHIDIQKLCKHINEAADLLHQLTVYLKNLFETITMTCTVSRSFPVTTGQIIYGVFYHCKQSETLYGAHLTALQQELKELFRACHELQLVYLAALENSYAWDLDNSDELDVLCEALTLNVSTGSLLPGLDARCTAAQWRAAAGLSARLAGRGGRAPAVRLDLVRTLGRLVRAQAAAAVEANEDPKVSVRCAKVSCFLLRALIRAAAGVAGAGAGAAGAGEEVLDTIVYLHSISCASPPARQLRAAAGAALAELAGDTEIVECFLRYDCDGIKHDDLMLGYALTLAAVARLHLSRDGDRTDQLIQCVFRALPHCHAWFNLPSCHPLRTKRGTVSAGLYEHLLALTLALCGTSRDCAAVERSMLDVLLKTDTCAAMFVVDLWGLLARHLHGRQLPALCGAYLRTVARSPQRTHLGRLIERLFENLDKPERNRLLDRFPVKDNPELWCVLKLKRLSGPMQKDAEEAVVRDVRERLGRLGAGATREDVGAVTTHLQLAATCSFMRLDPLEDAVTAAWLSLCPVSAVSDSCHVSALTAATPADSGLVAYVSALTAVTGVMAPLVQRSGRALVKVLHSVSGLVSRGGPDLKLTLIELVFKLMLYQPDSTLENQINETFRVICRHLFRDTSDLVRNKLYDTLRSYANNSRVRDIVMQVVGEEKELKETWEYFEEHGTLRESNVPLKDQLKLVAAREWSHKCVPRGEVALSREVTGKSIDDSSSFGFSDVETLFEVDTASEPASKKAKLDADEAEVILSKLEENTSRLAKVKENVPLNEYRDRILQVCEQLQSVVK